MSQGTASSFRRAYRAIEPSFGVEARWGVTVLLATRRKPGRCCCAYFQACCIGDVGRDSLLCCRRCTKQRLGFQDQEPVLVQKGCSIFLFAHAAYRTHFKPDDLCALAIGSATERDDAGTDVARRQYAARCQEHNAVWQPHLVGRDKRWRSDAD